MKRLFYILPLFFILFSCDKIEESERSLPVDSVQAVRPVLLEDFTGQNCVNCPDAARVAANIQKAMGKNLIIVGIHAGAFATSKFKTEAGNAYREKFYSKDGSGYPAGMMDRVSFDGNIVNTSFFVWGSYILQRIQLTDIPLFDMSMSCNYNATENSFVVNCAVKSQSEVSGVKLQLWITESHIVDYQRSNDGIIKEYEHNHVLRDAVNGIWGENIQLQPGLETTYTSDVYSLNNNKGWKPENMHIVGFVYNEETYEVLHVIEIPMLNN